MKLGVVTALVLAVGSTAQASVWDDATAEATTTTELGYDEAMDEGDQATRLAASQSTSADQARKLLERGVRSYEKAAELMPDRAEPHWRAGMALFAMRVDCSTPDDSTILCDGTSNYVDVQIYERILRHWAAAEELAPLDPRIKPFLFERALMHTKLATTRHLALARDNYEKLLDTGSTLEIQRASIGNTRGNLSETYMMLGDLDHAIASYRETILVDSSTAQMYGLAVAYDRDEQGAKAKEIIRALGEDAFVAWNEDVELHKTFYVPEGEVWYYKGLILEGLGRDKEAVVAWKRFLDSGAHPSYQPRAQDHYDKLKAKLLSAASGE